MHQTDAIRAAMAAASPPPVPLPEAPPHHSPLTQFNHINTNSTIISAKASEIKPDIVLNSPVGAKAAIYKWPLSYKLRGQKIDGAEEIIETIRWVGREYSEFKPAIENLLSDHYDPNDYDCIKNICDKYNKMADIVSKLNKGTSVTPKSSSRACQGLLKLIIQQVYNYAVADPTELNKYSPFSSETYGETSFEFMAQLTELKQFRPAENDTFIDLGSGVGHIVLQMAASVECKKCYGIEKADVPASYAKVMEERFKFWMNWHGKIYTEFEICHGDFFEPRFVDIIKNSTHILVNNYAFEPDTDYKLKQRFLDLNDGTQILSSKPFCSPKHRVSERHLTDLGSIMKVVEIHPEMKNNTVSWTHKPVPYYLHVLDASPVERYYERQKRLLSRDGKSSKRRRDDFDDWEEKRVTGPTTRKAWSEWCNSVNNSSNRSSVDSVKTSSSSRNNSTDTESYESAIENESESNASDTRTDLNLDSEDTKKEADDKPQDTSTKIDRRSPTREARRIVPLTNGHSANKSLTTTSPKKRSQISGRRNSSNHQQKSISPPPALYSVSAKPVDPADSSSPTKIPSIVIKVKPSLDVAITTPNESGKRTDDVATPKSRGRGRPSIKIDATINDENGKKVRQCRRKAAVIVVQDDNPPTSDTSRHSSPSRSNSRLNTRMSINPPQEPVLNECAANGTRAKRSQVIECQERTIPATKKRISNSERLSGLELLHAKTVESVHSNLGYFPQPAPGCEDFNLHSILETPSLPKVTIKDLSMFVSNSLGQKTIDRFSECVKSEFESFAQKLQRPGLRETLTKEIEDERARNRMLIKELDGLVKEIKNLQDYMTKAMKVHCDDLGIPNTPTSLVQHLGSFLMRHQELTAYCQQLEASLLSRERARSPPVAHSNSNQSPSHYRSTTSRNLSTATLDLSIKPVTQIF